MLVRFWFQSDRGFGYGVTAKSQADAEGLLKDYGYPLPSERIIEVKQNVSLSSLDKENVVPNAGPLAVRGVWYPCRNV
jgi:hypothetical protein